MTDKRVDYDTAAAVYDVRYRSGGPAGIAAALHTLAQQVRCRRLLEAGCGTGHWLAGMADVPGCELRCGLDYSAGMLAKAQHKDRALVLTRGTAVRLPFNSAAFDLVFCVHALHHFDRPQAFVREARRVTRPGGALAVVGIDPPNEGDCWYVYDYFPGTYAADLARYPTGETILRWMEEAGFVRCERRIAARVERDFVGRAVLDDPLLQKDGTSQLSLLTQQAFDEGMARIRQALHSAERSGEAIVFRTRIAMPVVTGFVPV